MKLLRKCQRTIFILTIIVVLEFIGICNLRQNIKNHECEIPVAADAMVEEPEPTPVSLGKFKLTAYCACFKCCGKHPSDIGYGITKSGVRAVEGVTVAADPSVIPLGTEITIDGVGERMVQDTGSAIKSNRIDVYFESHQEALEFGVQYKEVFMKGDL